MEELKGEFKQVEERFRRLIDQAADAIFIHDLYGQIVEVNQMACESLGYSREELIRLTVPDIEMDFDLKKLPLAWQRVKAGERVTVEGLHRRKDGTTFPVEVRVGLFDADNVPLMMTIARDISRRKAGQEALLRERERAARLEGVLQTVRTLQHEINNPLQALLTNLELLEQRDILLSEVSQTRLGRVKEAAERIHTTVQRISRLARAETVPSPAGEMIRLPEETEEANHH